MVVNYEKKVELMSVSLVKIDGLIFEKFFRLFVLYENFI